MSDFEHGKDLVVCGSEFLSACGSLYLFHGPMFSGKSRALTCMVSDHEAAGHKVLYVNSALDNRNPEEDNTIYKKGVVTTHDHRLNPSEKTEYLKVHKIADIPMEKIRNCDVIAVDEAQFFEDIIEVSHILLNYKKTIYVAGLMATSEGNIFGNMYTLIPFAAEVIRKEAICTMCLEEMNHRTFKPSATMTFCLENKTTDTMVGSNRYLPMCLYHWNYFRKMQKEGNILELEILLSARTDK